MDTKTAILTLLVIALVTAILRFLPFMVFGGRQTPPAISFLGRYLPYAIIGMLVIYCLKDVSVLEAPYGIPEAIAIAVVALLHLWKQNTLLSVVSGTLLYMAMVQFF